MATTTALMTRLSASGNILLSRGLREDCSNKPGADERSRSMREIRSYGWRPNNLTHARG
jgi:hypothetical protein